MMNVHEKSPPIMFDRKPTGEIILPGRWWQAMFERLSENEEVPPDIRRTAAVAARSVRVSDGLLPADTDTIEIKAPDSQGNPVVHEALPPETVVRIQLLRQ